MTPSQVSGRSHRLIDAAVAAGVALLLMLLALIATEEGSSPRDVVAYLLAAAMGVVLFWRRRFPVGVAVVSLVLVMAYHALGYPAVGNLPLAFALLNASYYAATPAAVGVAAAAMAGSLGWFLLGEERPLSAAVNFTVREVGVLAAVILAGSVLRSRRRLAEESQERVRLARTDQEARAAQRMTEERMEIAREIHDVVAHTVAVIGVQARAAADALPESTDQAMKALRIISEAARDATSELQATVGVLRGGAAAPAPAPDLDQLDALVEGVEAAGIAVEVDVSGECPSPTGLAGLVAYRIVQEALTNVVKHSGATRAWVEVAHARSGVRLRIEDDGVGGNAKEGHGIAGMRERVSAVGGKLDVGSSPRGGLRVTATLPARSRS